MIIDEQADAIIHPQYLIRTEVAGNFDGIVTGHANQQKRRFLIFF